MKTVTTFYYWEPQKYSKKFLVMNQLFLFYIYITFERELTMIQPEKLTEDGCGDQTHMHTQKQVH